MKTDLSLTELITACGEPFYKLKQDGVGKWSALSRWKEVEDGVSTLLVRYGVTPEEAVQNLLQALQSQNDPLESNEPIKPKPRVHNNGESTCVSCEG